MIHESESAADVARPASVRPLSKRPPMPGMEKTYTQKLKCSLDAPVVSALQSLVKATAQKNKELTELQKQEEATSVRSVFFCFFFFFNGSTHVCLFVCLLVTTNGH